MVVTEHTEGPATAPGDAAHSITEIRWHARGGQGAKTAATFLAESAVDAGFFAQGFPEYGPERMGAPIRAYNRIGSKPVRRNTAVRHPDIVIVLDDTLVESVDIAEGATEKTVFLINTAREPNDETRRYFRERIGERNPIYLIDANRIAIETIGRPIPNTVMVGAMLAATELLPVQNVIEGLEHKLSKKFPPKIVEGNVTALRRALEEVTPL